MNIYFKSLTDSQDIILWNLLPGFAKVFLHIFFIAEVAASSTRDVVLG
jgi:hypothetical protein